MRDLKSRLLRNRILAVLIATLFALVFYLPQSASALMTASEESDPTPVEVDFKGKLILEGDEGVSLKDIMDWFYYEVSPMDGAPDIEYHSCASDENGDIDVGTVTFTAAGTYTYRIEQSGSYGGVVLDEENIKTVTITVKEVEGKLVADIDGKPLFSFTNTYAPESVEYAISVNTWIEDMNLYAGEFKFELLKDGEVVATATNDSGGVVEFPAQAYDKVGDYTYTVREVDSGIPGMSYDPKEYWVVVHVLPYPENSSGKGELYAHCDSEDGYFEFKHTYAPTAYAELSVDVSLTGRDWIDSDSFTFVLEAVSEDADTPMPKSNQVTITGGNGTVTFDPIEFNEERQFCYRVTQVPGDATGIAYDRQSYQFIVDYSRNSGTNLLDANVLSINGDGVFGVTASFENIYTAYAYLGDAVKLDVAKTLINGVLSADMFSFDLKADDNAAAKLESMSLHNEGSAEGMSAELVDDEGTTLRELFSHVEFDQDDIGKTFVWTLREVNDGQEGYVYDAIEHTIEVFVKVGDSGELELVAKVDGEAVEDGKAEIVFTNLRGNPDVVEDSEVELPVDPNDDEELDETDKKEDVETDSEEDAETQAEPNVSADSDDKSGTTSDRVVESKPKSDGETDEDEKSDTEPTFKDETVEDEKSDTKPKPDSDTNQKKTQNEEAISDGSVREVVQPIGGEPGFATPKMGDVTGYAGVAALIAAGIACLGLRKRF